MKVSDPSRVIHAYLEGPAEGSVDALLDQVELGIYV